jgi:hypothetical protein
MWHPTDNCLPRQLRFGALRSCDLPVRVVSRQLRSAAVRISHTVAIMDQHIQRFQISGTFCVLRLKRWALLVLLLQLRLLRFFHARNWLWTTIAHPHPTPKASRNASHLTPHTFTIQSVFHTQQMPQGGRGGRGRGNPSRNHNSSGFVIGDEVLDTEVMPPHEEASSEPSGPSSSSAQETEQEELTAAPIVLDPLPSKMTIADALREKSLTQRRLNELQDRVLGNSRVEAGSQPLMPPGPCLEEVALLLPRIQLLTRAITHANYTAGVSHLGQQCRLIDLILQRDALSAVGGWSKKVTSNVVALDATANRYGGSSETKFKVTVPFASLVRQQESLDKTRQALESAIQYWNTQTRVHLPTDVLFPPVTLVVGVQPPPAVVSSNRAPPTATATATSEQPASSSSVTNN